MVHRRYLILTKKELKKLYYARKHGKTIDDTFQCVRCKKYYKDYLVRSKVWTKVVPKKYLDVTLCRHCFYYFYKLCPEFKGTTYISKFGFPNSLEDFLTVNED